MKLLTEAPEGPLFFCRKGFSLIEVVLAIGIFLVTVLALVGLLGPTLQSVDEVEKIDETSSVVNTVNAFLQSSPDINPGGSKFNAIYNAVKSGNYATIFVYRYFTNNGDEESIDLAVGFSPRESDVDRKSFVKQSFGDAAGPIYRIVLSASSVTPESHRSAGRTNNVYILNKSLDAYPEGYLAMEVRIFSEDPPGPNRIFIIEDSLEDLSQIEPIFTYNTAIVR